MMRVDTIDPTKTAMIVVDMQNDFVAPGGGLETPAARAMVPKLAEALQICRSAGIKVIYTTHVHRRDGSDMGLFEHASAGCQSYRSGRWHLGRRDIPRSSPRCW